MPPPVRKYRPYFTLADLHNIKLALGSLNHGEKIRPLEMYVDNYIKEIEFGLIRASHITKHTQTMGERLGLENDGMPSQDKTSPEFRYANDLMTPEEEKEYERINGFT